MKHLFAIILTALIAAGAFAQPRPKEYGKAEDFSDVVLIYGNNTRNAWDAAQLAPYVTHKYADGSEKWLFDSFVFMETIRPRAVDKSTKSFGFGNGMGGSKSAKQQDWEWILDQYITSTQAADPTKLAALDTLIGEKKAVLGAPLFRHKVILMCPAPKKDGTNWSSEPWGKINGKDVSFDTEAGRLAAVKWYIDQLVNRFNAAGYKNIDLDGIYWIEESMTANAAIIADANDYARSKGLKSYWMPHYTDGNEYSSNRWASEYKFDGCYFRPKYAAYKRDGSVLPKTQLNKTCDAAKLYGAGLVLEFDTSGKSNALHSADAKAHQRLIDQIDVFTELGVFDKAGVAYSVGSCGLIDMDKSDDPVDHATLDRLASIISARQQARYAPPAPPTN